MTYNPINPIALNIVTLQKWINSTRNQKWKKTLNEILELHSQLKTSRNIPVIM